MNTDLINFHPASTTQERLITRIVQACAAYPEIISVDINLRKGPVLSASGSLGVRVNFDQAAFRALRNKL